MERSPEQIYKEYIDKILDNTSAVDQLLYLIDNSDSYILRIECIEILNKIGTKDERVFNLLENLLISDSNEKVRNIAARVLKNNFLDRALEPMKWAIHHEKALNCLLTIVSTIGEINNEQSKVILLEKIKIIDNPDFNKSLRNLVKTKKIHNFKNERFAEIINNYLVIEYFEEKFSNINYQVEEGLVTELDLSGISSNLFGRNILRNLPEFINILKYLKKLDLKINRIAQLPKSIGELTFLKYLDLSNNNLKTLPESVGLLNSLESLYLRYNNLTVLPDSISN
ncbi:MAG: HEAT repeat domain-containing protein, partial [Promethearchaeota archaeon]